MDEGLKKRWVEALRSGKYRQTDGVLRTADGKQRAFCCLGVLCDVMGANWRSKDEDFATPYLDGRTLEADGEFYLNSRALDLAGFDNKTQKTLAGMNDDGVDFAHIADHIEANL